MSETAVRAPTQLMTAIVLLSIGAALFLVPRGAELGYLHLKNNNTAAARQDFEHLYAKGDRSPTTISSLITLAEAQSDPDQAIAYLKEFVALHPKNMIALRKLLELYREAMRPDDYLKTLLEVQQLEPSAAQARELEQIYRFQGPEDAHARMLQNLINKYGGTAADYLTLAQYDAANGNTDAALAVLAAGGDILRSPPLTEAGLLQITLLLDQNRETDAVEFAVLWSKADAAQKKPDDSFVIDLAQLFLNRGKVKDATQVLKPLAELPGRGGELITYYVQLLVGGSRIDDADAYLKTEAKGLPESDLMPAYVAVAIGLDQLDRAFSLMQATPVNAVPSFLLADLANAAIDKGRLDLLATILPRMDSAFFDQYPLIASQIALSKGDTAAALKWLTIAESRNTSELRELTMLEVSLNRRAAAYERLEKLSSDPANRDFIQEIALVLVEKGFAGEALPRFVELRRTYPDSEFGWALVAAATPASSEVRSWLATQKDKTLTQSFLQSLDEAAAAGGDARLRLMATERWNTLAPGDDSRYALLNAYAANADFQPALALLPPVETSGRDLHEFYEDALPLAAKNEGWLRQKTIAFWSAELKNASTQQEKYAAVDALVQLRQDALVVGPLKAMAKADPANWESDYIDTLQRLGRREELIAFLDGRIRTPSLSADDRRDLAYDLLDLGDKTEAIQALEINAADESPESDDVDELLFLWGPAPPPEEMNWLKDRARHAPVKYRKEWDQLVADRSGGTGDESSPLPVGGTTGAEEAFRTAEAARDKGDLKSALASYKAALAADPGNPAIARELALVELDLRHFDDAQKHLDLFYANAPADSEADFSYGEILTHESRKAEAMSYYQRALDRIVAVPAPSYDEQVMKADLLARLGRFDEAGQEYQTLLAAHPHDHAVRADYADMLLERGDTEAANKVMEQ